MIKYFDEDWEETTSDKATYAVELEYNSEGKLISSTQYTALPLVEPVAEGENDDN